MTWEAGSQPRVATGNGLLRYRMPGLAFDATVRCPGEERISQVGFVQFVVEGETRAAYDGGAVVIRFPTLPVIDAQPHSQPWTYPFSVASRAPVMQVRLEDFPQGTHPLMRSSGGARREWPGDAAPELASIERGLALVVILAGFDPAQGRYLPIRAWEWGTELVVERYLDATGRPDFRAARSRLREPVEVSAERLAQWLPKLDFTSPVANLAQDYWWLPLHGTHSRAVRLLVH